MQFTSHTLMLFFTVRTKKEYYYYRVFSNTCESLVNLSVEKLWNGLIITKNLRIISNLRKQ